ncbi:MAG: tripartite tricarboxylate transporter substrate binding protein [Burkholderiales bacterium]|nr:tripartite tricarboxylate transporter substrate binding protein [Burkholderiales bacterium]
MRASKRNGWIATAAVFMLVAGAAQAQGSKAGDYPAKPIRLIALSSPGSGPDVLGRLIGARFTEAWGQQVIVDTRPGASGIIGTEIAAKAAPDGYTLVIITSQAAIVSAMYDNLPFSLTRDFSPISHMGSTPFILAVHPQVAATTVSELIALAKSKPGQLRFGSGGSGSPPHLSAEILKSMTGINIEHVPYKGVTPAMIDTMAGHVQMVISVIPAVLSSVRSGRLRALGVTSAKRSAIVPELPAIGETVPGYEFIGWYSVFAPAKTPSAIINKLNRELVKAAQSPGLRDRLADIGVEATGSTPKELAAYLAVQIEKMGAAVKASGARPDR